MLALGAVLAATLLALPQPDRPLVQAAEVELRSLQPGGRGLTGEEAAIALAPFDEDRLRCRPLGCERWWAGGTVAPVSPVLLADLLVVAFDHGLAALDTSTGSRRWEVPLTSLEPAPETGWNLRAAELILDADGDDLLVWAPRGFVQLREADGTDRWSVTLPETRRLWAAELADDVVLVAGAANSADGPVEVVTAYDRRHGTLRWRQRVQWVYETGPDGALVRADDDRVVLLDPATGGAAFALEVEDPRWVSAVGAFFVARADGRSTVLLDRDTGTSVRALQDVADLVELDEATGGLALLVGGRYDDPDAPRPARVEAIGRDGTTRWERPVGCCATLGSSPPGTVVVRVGGDPPLVLAGDDGSELTPPPWHPTDELRWLSDAVLFAPGARTSLVLDRDGARIALEGDRPRIVNLEPLIVASRDGLLGIDRSAAAPGWGPSPKRSAMREVPTLAFERPNPSPTGPPRAR
jgi:hypothetical protein